MISFFHSSTECIFCRAASRSAFSIFVLHNNATAAENSDHCLSSYSEVINFPESQLFSLAVHIWNLTSVIFEGDVIH